MGKTRFMTLFLLIILVIMLIDPVGGEEEKEQESEVNHIAVLETDYGVIKFELYEKMAPITTEHFIELAEAGHYERVLFHRIVDDFVIQTGDGGGSSTIPLETHPNATHVDGAVGMARSEDPDSAEDQFYICDGAQHGLDGDYAVFGLVFEGMEVVRQIAEVPVYGENNPRPGAVIPPIWYNIGQPKEDVYLQKVTIDDQEINETDEGESSGLILSSGAPLWIVFVVVLLVAVALIVFLRRKKLFSF